MNPRVDILGESKKEVIDSIWNMTYDIDDMIKFYNVLQNFSINNIQILFIRR